MFFLDDEDRALIDRHRGEHMKLGFALQLVTVRWVGAFLEDPLDVPLAVLDFVAEQLEIALGGRAVRSGVAGPGELRRRRRRGHVVAVQVVAAVPPPESPRASPSRLTAPASARASCRSWRSILPHRRQVVASQSTCSGSTSRPHSGPDQGRPGGAGVEPRAAGGP